jgi:hypothetical protein
VQVSASDFTCWFGLSDPKSAGEILLTENALDALESIAHSAEGADAVVEAGILHKLDELLKSPHGRVCQKTCKLLNTLMLNDSTSAAVLDANPCQCLVSLLSYVPTFHITQILSLGHSNDTVAAAALGVLDSIAHSSAGAQAVVQSGRFDVLEELFRSQNTLVRNSICMLLRSLAHHNSTAAAVLDANQRVHLASLLR